MNMHELVDECRVSYWTVARWRQMGIISKPHGLSRKHAEYTDNHLRQCRRAKDIIRDDRITLADIAESPEKYVGIA